MTCDLHAGRKRRTRAPPAVQQAAESMSESFENESNENRKAQQELQKTFFDNMTKLEDKKAANAEKLMAMLCGSLDKFAASAKE